MSVEQEATCYRWSCDFAVAHAVFTSGLITAPVAFLHLVKRPHSGCALFFSVFAVFCTAISLILCLRFYAELKRPPWPRWLSASAGGQQPQDGDAGGQEPAREVSHELQHPEVPVMVRAEMQAALAAGRVPSYEHRDGAADCAVCLGEVEKGEKVRRLPACRHVFHRECIDLWLSAHATCPVCRRGVLPERPPEVVVDIRADHEQPGPTTPGMIFPGQDGPGSPIS